MTMEESVGTAKPKNKHKTGPLKSSPGFLKCMRSVYLYFKQEKEKGALNIPINSFIERTAVACGVGRYTLYNYAKKGLFNEQPTMLQQKKKKKRSKPKLSPLNDSEDNKKAKTNGVYEENFSHPKKRNRTVEIQTDPLLTYLEVETVNSTALSNSSDGSVAVYVSTDDGLKLERNEAVREVWPGRGSSVKDYYSKTDVWQTVTTINSFDETPSSTEIKAEHVLNVNCQTTSTDLDEL